MQKVLLEDQMHREDLSLLTKEKESLTSWHQGEKKVIEIFQEKGKRKIQETKCFICNQTWHFVKNCPKKSQKAIRLIPYIQIGEYDDIESLYSEQNELDDETEFALNQTDSSDNNLQLLQFPSSLYKKISLSGQRFLNHVLKFKCWHDKKVWKINQSYCLYRHWSTKDDDGYRYSSTRIVEKWISLFCSS